MRISADRGKALELKYQPRQVFWDSGARHNDNEETIIGTQLRLGDGATARRVGRRSQENANRIISVWFHRY
jgi:hypothetical protein